MPAYLVSRSLVKNTEALAEYSRNALPIVRSYAGKLLFKGGEADNLVGSSAALPNITVFEFPTMEEIKAFFQSPEYQALTSIRQKGAEIVLSAHDAL